MNRNITKKRILSFAEIKAIKPSENNEAIVGLKVFAPKIIAYHKNEDMRQYTGDQILVRQTVAQKLANLSETLPKNLILKVVFGYRHPDLQKRYFETERHKIKQVNPSFSNRKLDSLTHNLIAVPSVAGHPTGGAIDITILRNNEPLDMGTDLIDFSKPELIPTFSDQISEAQLANRLSLHDLMLSVNFAPFYGEWWHFSYGDREWAAFYSQPSSLYSPISINLATQTIQTK